MNEEEGVEVIRIQFGNIQVVKETCNFQNTRPLVPNLQKHMYLRSSAHDQNVLVTFSRKLSKVFFLFTVWLYH